MVMVDVIKTCSESFCPKSINYNCPTRDDAKKEELTSNIYCSPVKEDNLNIVFLPVLVKKVLEEVGDGLIGDVATDHDMSEEGEH